MPPEEAPESGNSWFFSAPWDPVVRRRGDALGLRDLSDYFADELAPGLTNGTFDARWVTLLGWSLRASHSVWAAAGGGNLRSREGQRQRYAWLRPLELLWVTWTLQLDDGVARQLPGRRSVTRWLDEGCREPRFAMSADQFRRYRQTGIYGAYRTLLRSAPGLTGTDGLGDGWSPGPVAESLFEYVNSRMPKGLRFRNASLEGSKWGNWFDQEENWWFSRGWRESAEPGTRLAPTPHEVRERLPDDERKLLAPSIFPRNHRREVVARVLAQVGPGMNHAQLCDHLSRAKELRDVPLAALPAFTRMADAGTDAMSAVWEAIGASTEARGPVVSDLARVGHVRQAVEKLGETSAVWLSRGDRFSLPGSERATALAEGQKKARSPEERVRELVRQHERHGGGLRWFQLQRSDRVEPLLPQGGLAVSKHRFRLWPLARLAHQCGIANLRNAQGAAVSGELDRNEEVGS